MRPRHQPRPRRRPCLAAASIAVTLLAAGCGGASRPATGAPGGDVLFSRALEGAVVPGPILARDGSVLAASNGGVLHALEPSTGEDRWRFDGDGSYGSDLSTSPLQLPDGTILWSGPRTRLFALTAAGRPRWSLDLGATGTTPVRGPDGTTYVQDVAGTLHAVTAAGRERWRLRVGDGVSYASAAVAADGTVYTTVGSELVAVGPAGHVRWRFAAGADVEVSPVVAADGTIVLGTNDPWEYGVSPAGRERWRWRRDVFTYSSPVATSDGRVRFGDHRGRLVTLDARDGRLVSVLRGHGQVWGSPAVGADGTVLFTGHPGEVFAFDARGRRVIHVTLPGPISSSPALGADGTAYVGTDAGRLVALSCTSGCAGPA